MTSSCPECKRPLPFGTAFRRGGIGLPDKRELDCPYCGAPLEPIRWTTLVPFLVILAIAIAARRLLEPVLTGLLDWKTLALLAALAVAHHIWALRRWKKTELDRSRPGAPRSNAGSQR